MDPDLTDDKFAYLLAPSKQEREPQEQQTMLHILQHIRVLEGKLFRSTTEQLLPSCTGPYELSAGNRASLVNESTDLMSISSALSP